MKKASIEALPLRVVPWQPGAEDVPWMCRGLGVSASTNWVCCPWAMGMRGREYLHECGLRWWVAASETEV